jgi:RHS repeat-associated protein
MEFVYDSSGLSGFKYNREEYLYQKNIQGDIIAILNLDGEVIAEYRYDAWGNCKYDLASGIATANPFRYRGYYYDQETGLYFLQTRYYDPETGRFISQDDVTYLDPEHINGLNLYAYCCNNPVMMVDPTGTFGLFALLFTAIVVGTAVARGTKKAIKAATTGANGWEIAGAFFGGAIIGAAEGAIVGGLIILGGAMIAGGAGIIGGAIGGGIALASGGVLAGGAAVAAGIGSTVIGGILVKEGLSILFTRIGNSGGYRIDHHYPNDHDPLHIHISGDDGKTKIDLFGNPIQGNRPMTPGERKAFWKLIEDIRNALRPFNK